MGRYVLVTKLKLIAIYNVPIVVKCEVQDRGLIIDYRVVVDLVYPEQHPYIEVGWAYTESAYNYHIVCKPSKPDLLILVDLAASSRSL